MGNNLSGKEDFVPQPVNGDASLSHLLLCDDEFEDRKLLSETISSVFGIESHEVSNVVTARDIFPQRDWLMVIIHSAQDPQSALALCEWIRSQSNIPILMMTKRNESVDEHMVIMSGADDYIVKPLDRRVIIARINCQLSRIKVNTGFEETISELGDISVNHTSHSISAQGKTVHLTRTEFIILDEFLRHPGSLVTREQLALALNAGSGYYSDHIIDTHLSRLRAKVRELDIDDLLITVRGVGFRLNHS